MMQALPDLSAPNFFENSLSIKVGGRVFHVHAALINKTSEFFKAASKAEWRTDPSKPIELADETPENFEKYCQWLYTKMVSFKNPSLPNAFYNPVELYILGEKIMDQQFQDDVIDAMIAERITNSQSSKFYAKCPDLQSIKFLYDGTPGVSPMKRLIVDLWAYYMTHDFPDVEKLTDDAHKPFLADLLPVLIRSRLVHDASKFKPWSVRKNYHVHTMTAKGAARKTSETTSEGTLPAQVKGMASLLFQKWSGPAA
ncbi:hypothetical protein ACN47E_007139 [Coniothyrium glycines]